MTIIKAIIRVILKLAYWTVRKITLFIIDCIYSGPNEMLPRIHDDFLKLGAIEVATKIRNKSLTTVEVVQACIRRIEEINGITNCVVENRFEEALKEAEAADALIAEGSKTIEIFEREKPLLGVPFTVKDSIQIKGVNHAVGMVCRKGKKGEKDATTVALLRAAGAIPIATTNVSECAVWWEANNLVYGRTDNPYHSQYTAGGSSGGEAALLACAGSYVGLGSDLGGSIRTPSYMCGIFAHLPTRNLINNDGLFPIVAPHEECLFTQGPMSKTAKDLRSMVQILTKPSNVNLKLDNPVDLKKFRYFYMDSDGACPFLTDIDPVDPEVKGAIKSVVNYFRKTYGIEVIKINLEEMKHAKEMWLSKVVKSNETDPDLSEITSALKYVSYVPLQILKGLFGFSEVTLEKILFCAILKSAPQQGSSKQKKYEELAHTLTEKLKLSNKNSISL